MLLVAFALSSVMFVSCNKYDEDIKRLDDAVASLQATIQTLQSQISAGALITDVANTEDGVKVTMNNGKSFVVSNGEDGKDASVWTIGEDGFWYLDGAKTEYKALGTTGATGADGKYYVPNATTGNFDVYQNGELVEATNISWKASAGSTVILEGNTLKFIDAEGNEIGAVNLGAPLGSVAFVPDFMDHNASLPTPEKPFLTMRSGYSETSEDNVVVKLGDYEVVGMRALASFDKSNEMELLYRLNPTNAYVNGAVAQFVNRGLTVKSENAFADNNNLLNVVNTTYGQSGDVKVKSTYNKSGKELDKDHDIAALQVWAGQNPVTSDYISVYNVDLSAVIANVPVAVVGEYATYRNKSAYPSTVYIVPEDASKGAVDAWVKDCVDNVGEGNGAWSKVFHYLKYDGQLDLKPLVGLYSNTVNYYDYFVNLGFTGISYEFSKPGYYLADDDKKTNQQDYITLTDGVVKVNPEYLTSAIGRTPVILVKAYALDNFGVKTLVRQAMIKLQITLEEVQPDDKNDNNITISEAKQYDYRTLTSSFDVLVGDMDWTRVSKEVYDLEGLTSANFWNYYGGDNDTYEVQVTVGGKELYSEHLNRNTEMYVSQKGIMTNVNLNNNGQETSYIKVAVNNSIKTQHTYANGADYKVVITIKSDNKKVHGDFVFTQEFSVVDNCRQYTFNPLYHFTQNSVWGNVSDANDIIVVKGQLNANNAWEMSSVVSEHFANNDAGENIFTYYNKDEYVTNVKSIEFNWTVQPDDEVTPAGVHSSDFTVALAKELDTDYIVKNMTLTQTLVNGEECATNYDVIFVNPFKAGASEPLAVYANGVGAQKLSVKPEVLVIDNEDDAIYKYDAKAGDLALTAKAINEYKVAAPSVSYAFDTTGDDYKTVVGNMSAGSVLDVDADGNFVWKNEGATLTKDYVVNVIATVTFEDLSIVKCVIPVKLSATKLQ